MLCCNIWQMCVIKNTEYRHINGLWGKKKKGRKRKLPHSLTVVNIENSNSYIFKFKDFAGQH